LEKAATVANQLVHCAIDDDSGGSSGGLAC